MCGTYLFEDVFSGGQTFSNVYSASLEDNADWYDYYPWLFGGGGV